MNYFTLKLYHSLPPFLQNVACSIHGYRLNRKRYGSYYKKCLNVVASRDEWSWHQWKEYQDRRLGILLRRAVDKVPYYRDLYRKGRFPIETVHSTADLERLPILEKEAVRQNPVNFLADDCNLNQMYEEHTSGSTGKPLKLYWSESTHQEWYAIFEQRIRRWNGVRWGNSWGLMGGQVVVPNSRIKPPFWTWNFPAQQLYLSVYHLSPQFLDSYLDEIERRNLIYMLGYPSALDAIAVHALQTRRNGAKLKAVIGNAEPFLIYQRHHVEAAFGCITRESYGNAELVSAAFECQNGSLHLAPDVGIVEIVDQSGRTLGEGESGAMVCTGLINQDHILIRYRVGDSASLAPSNRKCPCGIDMPIFNKICGRIDDLLVTPDGRRFGRLDSVFKADIRVKEAQIAQVDMDRFVVRCVPANGFGQTDKNLINRRLSQLLGKVNVSIEIVDSIPRDNSGKFKAAKNEMQRDAAIS